MMLPLVPTLLLLLLSLQVTPVGAVSPLLCPWPSVAAAVSASGGRLSVSLYNETQHGTAGGTAGSSDFAPAIRWAINASHLCGGLVFFPQGQYAVNSTIDVPSGTTFLGGAGRDSDQFQTGAEGAVIRKYEGHGAGPVFMVHNTGVHPYTGEKVRFENLVVIGGGDNAITISGGALIRIVNCGIHAASQSESARSIDTSPAGCDGCNAVLDGPHVNTTALLVINTYWMWVEDSSFFFNIGEPSENFGQRPSVILRGIGALTTASGAAPGSVNTVYLVFMTRVIFSGGAVQYQQLGPANQWPGFFQFDYCQTELSATPLLDIQARASANFQTFTIVGFRPDDTVAPNYLGKYPDLVAPGTRAHKNDGLVPVVALNCSGVPGCHLDGVSITSGSEYGGASAKPSPAIRVFSGTVNSVTILSAQETGSLDVLDAHNTPVGSWISRSAGGFTFVGGTAPSAGQGYGHVAGEATLTAGGRGGDGDTSQHAALVGLSGQSNARFAIDSDGSLHWGDGTNDTFHTSMLGAQSSTCDAKLLTIPANGVAKACVIVLWTNGDNPTTGGTMGTCEATHEGLDETNLELEISCRILNIKTGVVVAVRNHGGQNATLAAGRVIVVLRRYVV